MFLKLYTALVLPKLEYCSPVWSPFQQQMVQTIERVQQRATRIYVYRKAKLERTWNVVFPSYQDRLVSMGWISLENRRTIADIRLLCTIISDESLLNSFRQYIRLNQRTQEPEVLLGNRNYRRYSTIPRAIAVFRMLPASIRKPLPQTKEEVRTMTRAAEKYFITNGFPDITVILTY